MLSRRGHINFSSMLPLKMCIGGKTTYCFPVLLLALLNFLANVNCRKWMLEWVTVKEMTYTGFHILSVEKLIDSENQTYVTRIKAPNITNIENDETLKAWIGSAEIKQVSEGDGFSATYEAKVSTSINTTHIPPVLLTSGRESLSLDFNPFVTRGKQVQFQFNDCQVQVERQDLIELTTYMCTVLGCASRRSFSGSVGKITDKGVEETAELSSSPYIMSGHPSNYEQVSFLYIYHKGLEDDGVQIMSLKFLIEREQDDEDSDFIGFSKYGFSLI